MVAKGWCGGKGGGKGKRLQKKRGVRAKVRADRGKGREISPQSFVLMQVGKPPMMKML